MYSELELEGVLDEANVCVCATHTHSAPGGYAPHGLYNLTFGGAVSESFDALLNGAADALFNAFVDAFETSLKREPEKRTVAFARGALVGASANRSRSAHARNPETDTAPFARAGGVDETIAALVVGAYDEPERAFVPRGVAAWYAVHGTSLPGSNTLISGDNKGIASSLTESALRSALSGDDSAVTALVSLFETLRLTETNADRGLADAGAVAAAAAAAARHPRVPRERRVGAGRGAPQPRGDLADAQTRPRRGGEPDGGGARCPGRDALRL
jgi:neutral ceramidase